MPPYNFLNVALLVESIIKINATATFATNATKLHIFVFLRRKFCREYKNVSYFITFVGGKLKTQSKGGFILPTPSSALTRFHTPLKCV